MTPEDREELLKCSQRIAEILYQDACEQLLFRLKSDKKWSVHSD